VRGGEMLPTLPVGEQASALRGKEAGRFREVAGVSSDQELLEGTIKRSSTFVADQIS